MRATVLVRPKDGHPRPAGRGRRGLAPPPRLRGRGARGSAGVVDLEVDAADADPGPRRGRADVRAAAREPADRELRDRDRARVSERRARESPSSSSPARTTTATRPGRSSALGADAVLVWHADGAAARRRRRGRPPRRVLVRRLPALRRDRPLRAGDDARSREFAADGRPGARDLQRLPDPLRGRAAARRAATERVALVRLPRRRRCASERDDAAVHLAAARPGSAS